MCGNKSKFLCADSTRIQILFFVYVEEGRQLRYDQIVRQLRSESFQALFAVSDDWEKGGKKVFTLKAILGHSSDYRIRVHKP